MCRYAKNIGRNAVHFRVRTALQVFTMIGLWDSATFAAVVDDCPSAALPREAPYCREYLMGHEDQAGKASLPFDPASASKDGVLNLRCIEWHGNTVVSRDELNKIANGILKSRVGASDLEALRNGVSRFYFDKGYITSGALICPQQVESGILHVDIKEGERAEIKFSDKEGDGAAAKPSGEEGKGADIELNGLSKSYIENRLKRGAAAPFNATKLSDGFQLLLRDRVLGDPLISYMRGALQPGAQPGQGILEIEKVKAQPYQLYARTDNYMTPAIGGFAGRIGGKAVGLTPLNEQIDADAYSSYDGGSVGFNTGIEIPVGALLSRFPGGWDVPAPLYDTHLNFRYTDNDTSLVEKPYDALNIKTRVSGYEGGISQTIYHDLKDEVMIGGSLAVRQSDSTLQGEPYSFVEGQAANAGIAQSTVLRLWQQYAMRRTVRRPSSSEDALPSEENTPRDADNYAFVFRSTFNQGLNALGSTVQKSGLPSGDALSWLGQTNYTYLFGGRSNNNDDVLFGSLNHSFLVLKGAAQLAASPLLPLERAPLGGVASVRGYRENFFVRDNVFNTSVEFHWAIWRESDKKILHIIPFMDYGGVWNNPTVAERFPKKDYLHSVGLGFSLRSDWADTEFYWAHDIAGPRKTNTSHNLQDDGVHFRVTLYAF